MLFLASGDFRVGVDLQLLERHGDLIGLEGELDRFKQSAPCIAVILGLHP